MTFFRPASLQLPVWGIAFALAFAHAGRCRAEPLEISPGISARLRTVRAEIVAGRVELAGSRSRSSSTSVSRRGNLTERLKIDSRGDPPLIEYELLAPDHHLRISSEQPGWLEISLRRKDNSGQETGFVEFAQRPHQRLVLTVQGEQQSVKIEAASLWHLQLSQPALCRTHLNPLLELLRAGWNLADTADAIEALLLETAIPALGGRRQRWQDLIDQLASDEFSDRRAADRQLREAGAAVLPFLQTLDRQQLDAEQWFRVRRIIGSLSGGRDEDTAESVVLRLANDPRVWHSLLARDDDRLRQRALEQLSRLLDDSITLDPLADAATRARLVEEIGRRIGVRMSDQD